MLEWRRIEYDMHVKVSCTESFTRSAESLQVNMPGKNHFSDFIPFLLGSHACSFCECAQLSSETPPQEGQCAKTHSRGALRLSRRRTLFRGVPDHFFGLRSIVPSQCDFGGARCAHKALRIAPGAQSEPQSPLLGCLGDTFRGHGATMLYVR